ncbi:MAG TPA: hypothetical protein VK656_05025 [Candidatus Acidoferrum sp.]|jgi:hypothetical protein|nr:hypothetical protein [Candidatus Acidoferrum sp.]
MIELMLQAERALSMGLVDQAEHLYWQAVESDGRNVIAIVGLAKVALARGDDRTALQFARKALELDPEDGAATRLVERLEDLARLRTGSVPAQSDPPAGPSPTSETEVAGSGRPGAPQPAVADAHAPAESTAAPEETPPPTIPQKRSRADIEWPATDVLGAAPSIPPRTVPPRPTNQPASSEAAGSAAAPVPTTRAPTAGPPPEPAWPATLPPVKPLPQRPRPEPEKKKGLLGRFRKNG